MNCTGPASSLVCDAADCNDIILNGHGSFSGLTDAIPFAIQEGLNDAIQNQLKSIFEFNGGIPGPCKLDPSQLSSKNPPPGDCTKGDLRAFLGASATYLKWQWFASPFGPYNQVGGSGWMPVTGVTSQVESESDGALASLTFAFDNDLDEDGILTPDDAYPLCSSAPNTAKCPNNDCDNDGIPDNCDVCPYSSDNDSDGDGICGLDEFGDIDNCVNVANPGQENANRVAEMYRQQEGLDVATLGDACDPVPVPDQEGRPAAPGCPPNLPTCCFVADRSTLDVRPLQSYPLPGLNEGPAGGISQVSDPITVMNVATSVRFCQPNPMMQITCKDQFDIRDARFNDTTCAPIPGKPLPAGCTTPETGTTHFHRMTFSKGQANGTDPNGNAAHLDYNRVAGDVSTGSQWKWNYAADGTR